MSYDDHWKRGVDYGRRAGEIAEELGLTIGLEHVEARFPLSVRAWRDLIGDFKSP